MRVVGNCEYGVIFYRDKLPKFNNHGRMIMNCMDWERDNDTPKVHPNQKPLPLLENLIELFTDENDVVIDPCAGSFVTGLACLNTNRKCYGFEINKQFCNDAENIILKYHIPNLFVQAEEEERQRKINKQKSLFEGA